MLFCASLVKIFLCKTTSDQNKTSSLARSTKTVLMDFESGLRNIVHCYHLLSPLCSRLHQWNDGTGLFQQGTYYSDSCVCL